MSDESPRRQRWWSIEGWGLRRKVTAVLAVPVIVAMVLGGLRVQAELSNAIHFSSAADQVVAVPDIVDFSTAFATSTAINASGTATPEDLDALRESFEKIKPLAENPDFDPAITADLTQTIAAAETLYGQMQAGPVPVAQMAKTYNEVRDSLNRIVEAILDQIDDPEVLGHGTRLINAWYSQRYLFGQVLGIIEILENPETSGTALVTASGGELAMLDLLARSYPLADSQIADLRSGIEERTAMVEAAGQGPLPLLDLRASMLHSVDVYSNIINEASHAISETVIDRASETRSAALRDTAFVLAALLVALVLALLVSRSLVGPIRRLRYGTLKVARQELPEAIDRIKVGDSIEDIEFTRVPVETTEEIGQLARAVDDMHGQALRLAGEQAHLRLQISDMFETLARRSKSLVEQQLGLIERLEFEEKDPSRLESLFKLDHLAARMRRNGDNLLILSGTRMRRGQSAPVQLGDILRAAMSEVEDYQRVEIGSTPDGALSGAVATDIVHLLAELVDNALRASPPDSTVTFSFARAVDGGLLVEIADRGIGIPSDELELINDRLRQGGEVGPDTARHMGLFVTSRLADRHGLTVRLRPTFDTARNPGITASVHIPDVLLMSPLALAQPAPVIDGEAEEISVEQKQEAPLTSTDREHSQPIPEYLPVRADARQDPRVDDQLTEIRRPDTAPAGFAQSEPGYREQPQQSQPQAFPPAPAAHAAPTAPPRQQPPREQTPTGLPQRQPGSTPGLPQRQPGSTPGLPQRSPGSTPGLPQPDGQQAPRRVQPDAAAAFASALPSRANRTPVDPNTESGRRESPEREQDPPVQESLNQAEETRDSSSHAVPAAPPIRESGLPQRRPAQGNPPASGSGLPQRHPGATPGVPVRAVRPPQDAPESGLPQRNPGATPGLPQRRPGSTPGLPLQSQDGSATSNGHTAQPTRSEPDARPAAVTSSGLPQRRPGATPSVAPLQAGPPPSAENRRGGAFGLPRRQPGTSPRIPQSAARPASIADGGSVSEQSDAQNAARHRYRTNSAKTASFFQPRPDVGSPKPHSAAGNPIFSDMMSDWLVDPTNLPEDRRKREWHSAADSGWQAAQRAAEVPVEEHTTSGLPRRAPGERLVPGAVREPATAEQRALRRRDPESIRANLSRHQQGVRNGRASATTSNRENNEQGVR
ncbi:HAMP domain-containing protein [Rhodococcus sp. HNM0563]|uniref:sensor histidine kinase n=1 Tax=Rhodococcus sp. HNM0563 TaxID=2716339 RepID=UPI00146D0A7B|nr:ATP-binding protein [Rhodococcus sp. HNM0563]NLU63669.1 HAMP domain-containing protein [Rhodococcus sp. HNM0563]